jgi:signal transduction histidine kinase
MPELLGAQRYANAEIYVDMARAGQRIAYEEIITHGAAGVRHAHVDIVPEIKEGAVVGLFMLDADVSEIREAHERIRSLVQRVEAVREEERRDLAVTLHDGIAQDLFAIKLSITHLGQRLRPGPQVRKEIDQLTRSITACMEDTRRIANDLRPDAMLIADLGAALTHHARNLAARCNLDISVHVAPGIPAVDESARLLFFRAAQEALTNVARHAQAGTVDIELKGDAREIEMSVADDGVGITEGALSKPRSLGLLGIRERFEALGGRLKIERRASQGTLLTVSLPHLGPAGAESVTAAARG